MSPRFLAEALTQVSLPGQLAVLALMLGCGIWVAVRPDAASGLGLALCAAVWLRANSRLEGRILITLDPAHGLTLADLLVPALFGLALLRVQASNRCADLRESGMLEHDRAARPRKGRADVEDPSGGPIPATASGGGLPAGRDLQVSR
jgi:hypothetical protein